MVDIEKSFKKNKVINLLNQFFKKHNRKKINDHLINSYLKDSNENKLLTGSINNLYEYKSNIDSIKLDENNFFLRNNSMSEDMNRRLSTPILSNKLKNNFKKKPNLKFDKPFCSKFKLMRNQNSKNLDKELYEEYNYISTESNSSYLSLDCNSPVSPKIKSIDEDIEALTLSRQDNPFIQSKIEKLSSYSGINNDILSMSNISLNGSIFNSTKTLNKLYSYKNQLDSLQDSNSELNELLNDEKNKEDNLHDHLIRSPPPQFPKNFSEFIFPPIGSPLRSITIKNNSISNLLDSNKTPNKFLSPFKKNNFSSISDKFSSNKSIDIFDKEKYDANNELTNY